MVQFYQKVKAKIRTEILNVRFSTVLLKPTPDDFWHLKDLTIYWQNQAAFHHRAVCSCMSHWIGMFPLIHYPLALSWFFKSSQARAAVPTRIGPPWHRFATSIPPILAIIQLGMSASWQLLQPLRSVQWAIYWKELKRKVIDVPHTSLAMLFKAIARYARHAKPNLGVETFLYRVIQGSNDCVVCIQRKLYVVYYAI